MRRNLIFSLSKIHLHHCWGVDRISLVGIDDDTKQSRVGVDQFGLESCFQIMKHRSIIKISKICHVFTLLEFRWINLSNFIGLKDFFLKMKE